MGPVFSGLSEITIATTPQGFLWVEAKQDPPDSNLCARKRYLSSIQSDDVNPTPWAEDTEEVRTLPKKMTERKEGEREADSHTDFQAKPPCL